MAPTSRTNRSTTSPNDRSQARRYRSSLAAIERDRERLLRSLKTASDHASARSALLDAQLHKALERDFRRRAFLIGEAILALPNNSDLAYTVMALLDRDLKRPEDRKLFFPDTSDTLTPALLPSDPKPPAAPEAAKGSRRAENRSAL